MDKSISWQHQEQKGEEFSCSRLGLSQLQLQNPSEVQFKSKGYVNTMFRLAVVDPALPRRKRSLTFQPVTGRLVFTVENGHED